MTVFPHWDVWIYIYVCNICVRLKYLFLSMLDYFKVLFFVKNPVYIVILTSDQFSTQDMILMNV